MLPDRRPLLHSPVMPGRRLGQHFLADASWRARILSSLCVDSDDVWVEIGAGHGEMTHELARSARRVVAVEVDSRLVEQLRRLAGQSPNIEIAFGDVLQLDLARIAPETRFKVYGNLPYYISSPILHRLFQFADRIDRIHVVLQLEVAARLVARPSSRSYGYLSVLTQFYARPELVLRIPPGAFRPRPKVASALVCLRLPGAQATLGLHNESAFLRFVQACFALKRKTLLNNLRRVLSGERAEALLRVAGLPSQVRAEQLDLNQLAALFRLASPS